MLKIVKPACLAALIALAGPLAAQENEAADAPAEEAPETTDPLSDLNMGTPVHENGNPEPQPGDVYEREVSGDWTIRCVLQAEGPEPCQMYQLLRDAEGNPVAEIGMFPIEGQPPAVAGANIVAPLETFLPSQLTLTVDGGTPRRYPFTFCSARPFSPFLSSGCVARVGFDEEAVNLFRRGASATLTMSPALAPEETVEVTISLIGFTAAFEAQAVPAPAE